MQENLNAENNEQSIINNPFKQKLTEFEEGQKQRHIAIFSHVYPDADALCSSLALKNLIQDNYQGCYADVFISSEIDDLYSLILRDEVVNPEHRCTKYDVGIVLDCPNTARIGESSLAILNNISPENIINIDHHATNERFGAVNYVASKCSSTCEIIYLMATNKFKWSISDKVAKELFQGIITDTNMLQTLPINKVTFKILGELTNGYNFDYQAIMEYYSTKSLVKARVHAKALSSQRIYADGKLITMEINNNAISGLNAKHEDTLGIVDMGLKLENAMVSALFVEEEPEKIYVSLRGNGQVNIGEIASSLGGGGGDVQAAYTREGPIKEVKQELINILSPILEDKKQNDELIF